MVRHLNMKADRRALIVVFVGGIAVVWHILACQESPMAFSPTGDRLALTVMEPYDYDNLVLQGPHAWRLLVLDQGQRLRTVETSITHMLTGPAYSPDGKSWCYFRIPLLSQEASERLKEEVRKPRDRAVGPEDFYWPNDPAPPREAGDNPPPAPYDLTLPPAQAVADFAEQAGTYPPVPATLVVRDGVTDAVLSEARVELPIKPEDGDWAMAYMTLRPQYTPDGQWVYFSAGGVAFAVNVITRAQHVLAVGAPVATLSPDSKTLAFLTARNEETVLGFVRTDGQAATYRRWHKNVSPAGLTWSDAQTVALLEPKAGDTQWVHLVRKDGTLGRSVPLRISLPGTDKEKDNQGRLAVSPNGRYLVVGFERNVFFMRMDGTLCRDWHDEKGMLVQPASSPDSTKVAFKRMTKQDTDKLRSAEIVFFTPEGKELSAVAIPPLEPGTTRPAS